MKVVYGGLVFQELVDVNGIIKVAFYDGHNEGMKGNPLCFADIGDFDKKEDPLMYRFVNAACWDFPTRINPIEYSDGRIIDYQDWEQIRDIFRMIAARITRILYRSMYFTKEDEYIAICVNFIFNTYFKDVFEYAPRIILTGSTISVKSRLQAIMGHLCYRGYYSVRPTAATLFRMIHLFDITPIIDEVQNLHSQSKSDMLDIFYNGDKKGCKIPRINPNTLAPESFNIYGPMMISNKAGGPLTEDTKNRAFTIKMLGNTSKSLDVVLDVDELTSIRNDLYSLFALYRIHPESFRLKELFIESIEHISGTDGNRICDYLRANPYAKPLENRSKDIATTYYPLARLTSTEEEILKILTEEQQYSAERLKETMEAHMFRSFTKCSWDIYHTNPLATYDQIIKGVLTKTITDTYNEYMRETGNVINPTIDGIKSNKVTRMMRDMGFSIRKGNGNQSYIDWTPETDNAIMVNLGKFGTDEEKKMISLIKKRGVSRDGTFKNNSDLKNNSKTTGSASA